MSKKATKKSNSTLTPQDRADIIKVLNKSRSLVGDVLECGSAMANDCHEVDNLVRKLGGQLGFKQENWYSDFK